MCLLELKDIYKSYRQDGLWGGRRQAEVLKGVNLKVEAGRCLGLLGASGCGKSTTGRLAIGLEKPDSGEVFYQGRDLSSLTGAEKKLWRRNFQVVFQNSHGAVNPRHRVWRIISEPLLNYGAGRKEGRARAAELLVRVGLAEKDMDKLPHQFSGGELQRVCLARALALKPEFILLDEAVSSLDMLSQSLVLDLLAEVKRETGAAFLFISHDLRVLMKVADSLAVMNDGRISSYLGDLSKITASDISRDQTFLDLARSVLPPEPSANSAG